MINQINYRGSIYKINYMDSIPTNYIGWTECSKEKIFIYSNQTKRQQFATLLHECFHPICAEHHIEKQIENYHDKVYSLSLLVFNIFMNGEEFEKLFSLYKVNKEKYFRDLTKEIFERFCGELELLYNDKSEDFCRILSVEIVRLLDQNPLIFREARALRNGGDNAKN